MREAVLGALGRVSDALTVAEHAVTAPLLKRKGIDERLTRTREVRVVLLTEILRRANEEGGGIASIQAALGGDDGDMDEFAEALLRSEVVRLPEVEVSRIRVNRTPEGSAPWAVRKQWEGVELLGVKLPPDSEQVDLVSGEPVKPRESYAVLKIHALEALSQKSPEARAAADWFRINVPVELPALTFGVNEVEIVSK